MKDFANALLDAVVQTTLVGLFLVQDARPVFATPAMAQMVGWGVDEVIAQDDALWFVHPEDRDRVMQYLSDRLGEAIHETFVAARAVHRDGQVRAVHIRAEGIEFRGHAAQVVLVIDVSERRRMEEQLRAHKSRLQLLASTLARAEEQERRRIATALHDQIGQALAAATMKISALQGLPEYAEAGEQLSEIHRLISLAIEETRSLTFELAPPVLYELGLVAALEWLGDQTRGQHGLLVEVVSDDLPKPLEQEIQVVVFRCVLELLNNVVKHAEARAATVSITRQGSHVRVVVVDEGAGSAPRSEGGSRPPPSGFGLFNVRERIEQHGGQFSFESEVGRGTRVSLLVPIQID